MRIVSLLAIGLAGSVLGAGPVPADHAPVLVIPGRPGIPVVINGYDGSYTVVEGDWGLYRPGHVPPAIVSGRLISPAPFYSGAYFPSQGRRPGYGRREVEPPPDRRLPRPAPSYYREWGTQSQALPATLNPPAYPTSVISASSVDGSGENGPGNLEDRREHRGKDRDHRRHSHQRQKDRARNHGPKGRH